MTKKKDPKDLKKRGPKPIIPSAKDAQKKIDEYFAYCDARIQQVYSAKADGVIEVLNPAPYTVPGLAYALGFSEKSSLYNQTDPEIIDVIKRALLKIESDHNEKMIDKGVAGSLFSLKNHFGYVDEQKHEHTGKDGGPIETVDRSRALSELMMIIPFIASQITEKKEGEK